MMDAVLNHVGYGIDAGFHPFNDTDQFHGCQFCATMYCQVINDDEGKTIASASTKEKGGVSKSNIEAATKIGVAIAERATAKGVTAVVFDRAGFSFHGKVKALADAAREKGLKF